MNGKREVCQCGHAKATHHHDEVINGVLQKGACLGMACACKAYVSDEEPRPKRVLPASNYARSRPRSKAPHESASCTCDACREYYRSLRY